MKVARVEVFLVGREWNNLVIARAHTDTGLTGLGEGTMQWQARTVADRHRAHGHPLRPRRLPVRNRAPGPGHVPQRIRARRPGAEQRDRGDRIRALGHLRQGPRTSPCTICSAERSMTQYPPTPTAGSTTGAAPAKPPRPRGNVVDAGYRGLKFDPFWGLGTRSRSRRPPPRRRGRRRGARGGRPRCQDHDRWPRPLQRRHREQPRSCARRKRRLLVRGAGRPGKLSRPRRGGEACGPAHRGRRALLLALPDAAALESLAGRTSSSPIRSRSAACSRPRRSPRSPTAAICRSPFIALSGRSLRLRSCNSTRRRRTSSARSPFRPSMSTGARS